MKWILVGLAAFVFICAGISQVILFQIERKLLPTGKFITVNGTKIHFIDQGRGPVLVLLHGASSNALDIMRPLGQKLAEHFRVIAIDRPGHGHSERAEESDDDTGWTDPLKQSEIALGVLDGLGIERATLVGHSWAGSAVMMGLLEHSNRIRAGVLLAGAVHSWPGGTSFLTTQLPGVPLLGPILLHTMVPLFGEVVIDSSLQSIFAPSPVPNNYVENSQIKLIFEPKAFKANAQDMRLLNEYLAKQYPRFKNIQQPVLMISSDSDSVVPASNHSDRLRHDLPRSEIHYLPGAGHAIHNANADEIVKLIHAWFQQQLVSSDRQI